MKKATKTRLLYHSLKHHIDHKNALVVTGMRQVGKTTLLRQIYGELIDRPKLWFDFDNPLDQLVFEDIEYRNIASRLFSQARVSPQRLFVFIDEIQNFPEITKIMKVLIDQYQMKFIVTGSSSFYLKNLFPESLAGRKFLYELSPLSFQEFLYFKEILTFEELGTPNFSRAVGKKSLIDFKKREEYFDEYMRYGGFPEVVSTTSIDTKKEVLKNLLKSFFEKDLQLLSDYKDIRELRDLILLLVPRVASMLDVNKIASELGTTDRAKIYSYLEFLQSTFFLRLLPKYSKSIDRSVAGGKKIYFADTGILNTLGNVNDGQLFENTLVNQLSSYGSLSFFNKRGVSEIDIILDKKTAIECKLTGSEQSLKEVGKKAAEIDINKAYVASRRWKDLPNIVYPHFF